MTSSSFDLLAPSLKQYVWRKGWQALQDIQEQAFPAVLAGGDVIIAGPTASGKTEAAILPLLTRILSRGPAGGGFSAIYVAPMKALINDQFERLTAICDAAGVPAWKWHGDVATPAKTRALRSPAGVLLITPESLEAMHIRQGREIPRLFAHLEAVVIDECHAFIGTERGVQLGSILTRTEVVCGRERIDRIGLSATLGDMSLAAEALRPGSGDQVRIVKAVGAGHGLSLQVKGFIDPGQSSQAKEGETPTLILEDVADYLTRHLRGGHHLMFAGSRSNVETYSCALAQTCAADGVPNEFFAHHGNLSKVEREAVEQRLREGLRPTTAVATTTLGAGIDVGTVTSVVQIGPGPSVAALRQRAGRSGRRNGAPAIIRIVAVEPKVDVHHHPVDQLHLDLLQTIATVECLTEDWCETPPHGGIHLSTLLHQVLALIMQTDGIRPFKAWSILCERGPFRHVDKGLFTDLLRHMADPGVGLIELAPDRTLMLGRVGERIASSYQFYAVFSTPDEYRIVADSRTLGTYPITSIVAVGQTIIFCSKPWEIWQIDNRSKAILVKPSVVAMPPIFSGQWTGVDDHVVSKMLSLICGQDVPRYLSRTAVELLQNARTAYERLCVGGKSMIKSGDGTLLLPWVGTKKLDTFGLALATRGLRPYVSGHAIEVPKITPAAMTRILEEIATSGIPDGDLLARSTATPFQEKFDHLLSPELLRKVIVAERLDLQSVPDVAARLIGGLS